MATQVTPAERLLDLVLALTHATHRMTRSEIRTGVAGYSDAPSEDAFERMFERDKTTLRELGVPLITLVDDAHGDDVGYRIDLEDYDMPAIDLTAEELGVLSVAAAMWEGAELDAQARRGLTKLRALAPGTAQVFAGHTLRLPLPEGHLDPLLKATTERNVVTFSYRTARTDRMEDREVEPWRLLVRDGAWYLQAWDRLRHGERMFRLSRISGRVRTLPDSGDRHEIGPAPSTPQSTQSATVRVRTDHGAQLRLRAWQVEHTPLGDILTLPLGDSEELAALIAGYTDAVEVLHPTSLRDAVISRLAAVSRLAAGEKADA